VFGPGTACVIDVETEVLEAAEGRRGEIIITGIIEEEEMGKGNHILRRKSMVMSSVENVRTALSTQMGLKPYSYDIHVNFPGGTPVDGPSAGLAIAVSMYSAMTKKPVPPRVAFTGEISLHGEIRPVGGVDQKLNAAEECRLSRVFVPQGNWQERYLDRQVKVVPASHLSEVIFELSDGT
jgi:Lon-like ATP-dependent protease